FSLDDLNRRSRQTAFLVPGLELSVTDLRPEASPDQPATRTYKYDGGISEFVEYLAQDQRITDVIRLQGTGEYTETIPVLDPTATWSPPRWSAPARSTSHCAGARTSTRPCAPS